VDIARAPSTLGVQDGPKGERLCSQELWTARAHQEHLGLGATGQAHCRALLNTWG